MGKVKKFCLVFLLVPGISWAHPPYEHVAQVVTDSSGRELRLVLSYIDGIMLSDPVKLVLRDDRGETVSETESVRDVSIFCPSADRCFVFLSDGDVFPQQALRLSGRALVPASGRWLKPVGLAVHVGNHWIGYTLAMLFFFAPLAVIRRLWRLRGKAIRAIALTVAVPLSLCVLVVWLWTIVGLSELSFRVVSIFVGTLFLAGTAISRMLNGPKQPARLASH